MNSTGIGSGTRICCCLPGTHHLTVTHAGKTVWSGDVTVVAGKKVIVDLSKNGTQKTVDWKRGEKSEGRAAIQGRHRERDGGGGPGDGKLQRPRRPTSIADSPRL